MHKSLYLHQLGMVCALGHTLDEIKQPLFSAKSGITVTAQYSKGKPLPLGMLPSFPLPSLEKFPLPQQSRNNQLALAALEQIRPSVDEAIEKFGPHRIGVILGTSTSGIAEGEKAFYHYARTKELPAHFHYGQQEMGSLALTLASFLNISGPAYVHSSACASSGKAMASAARLINMGVVDAVITGGVDSLCEFTVAGFSILESLSSTRCNPLSQNRNGINIGEGAALFLMRREPSTVSLSGWGESSDAYHISAPDPMGKGAKIAIEQALQRANISPGEIDYINLHGTATRQNDAMESHVIRDLFGDQVPISSTKPFTGHTLGAASAIDAGLCWLCLQDDNPRGLYPPHLWDGECDQDLPALNIAEKNHQRGKPLRYILSNSFAFGGSNVALVLGREQ